MDEKSYPLPGDVLFYKSNGLVAKIITFFQRLIGMRNPEFMHAALMIDYRQLMEARMNGVKYKDVKTTAQQHGDAIVLRNPSAVDRSDILSDLRYASFFYHGQKYNLAGIPFRSYSSDARSICSNLVKNILLKSKLLDEAYVLQYENLIYPPDLFDVLKAAGFQQIGPYDSEELDKITHPKLDIPDYMKRLDKIDNELFDYSGFMNTSSLMVERTVQDFEKLGSILSAYLQFCIYSEKQITILGFFQKYLESIPKKLDDYQAQRTAMPKNSSRKKTMKRKSAEYKVNLIDQLEAIQNLAERYSNIYLLKFLSLEYLEDVTSVQELMLKNCELLYLTNANSNNDAICQVDKFSVCIRDLKECRIQDTDVSLKFNEMMEPVLSFEKWLVSIVNGLQYSEKIEVIEKHAIELAGDHRQLAIKTLAPFLNLKK